MCIRDRGDPTALDFPRSFLDGRSLEFSFSGLKTAVLYELCLLYTSDAADERSSVDLGGRRILKKKKVNRHSRVATDRRLDRTIYRQ